MGVKITKKTTELSQENKRREYQQRPEVKAIAKKNRKVRSQLPEVKIKINKYYREYSSKKKLSIKRKGYFKEYHIKRYAEHPRLPDRNCVDCGSKCWGNKCMECTKRKRGVRVTKLRNRRRKRVLNINSF